MCQLLPPEQGVRIAYGQIEQLQSPLEDFETIRMILLISLRLMVEVRKHTGIAT